MIPDSTQKCFAVGLGWFGLALYTASVGAGEPDGRTGPRSVKMALVQFDSVPEKTEQNLDEMERLTRAAVGRDARWVLFHEGCLTDYTPRLDELAESVPDGSSCQRMMRLARELDCMISFGMSERDGIKVYITQVFVGPRGLIHRYRKVCLSLLAPRHELT